VAVQSKNFLNVVIKRTSIPVRISNVIIKHFSEGLYSSPHKAIEELVSNSYDAGAHNVWVIVPSDLNRPGAAIVVADDGTGMGTSDLKQHWVIGSSIKRTKKFKPLLGREPIGRFGIGKLATYVLAAKFTHVTKSRNEILAATMDYQDVEDDDESVLPEKMQTISIPLRALTMAQAEAALKPWFDGDGPLKSDKTKSWTVAILSELHDMARQISIPRLEWVLSTAMPLRDDFTIFVNDKRLAPAKLKLRRQKTWTLGKDLKDFGSNKISAKSLKNARSGSKTSPGLEIPVLGTVTGYFELYYDLLTSNKPAAFDRSHGFFVYARGRLLNVTSDSFGIDSNLLKHGVFSRFRMVLNADALDEDIRSTREGVREGALLKAAQAVCKACFDIARTEYESPTNPSQGPGVGDRFAGAPTTLTTAPLLALVNTVFDGNAKPKHLAVPTNLSPRERKEFVANLAKRAEGDEFIASVELVDEIEDGAICVYDAATGALKINRLHPYVANFLSEYHDADTDLPVQLLAISEVLLEADLYRTIQDRRRVETIMERRDELLRSLAKSPGRRTALMLADAVREAATDQKGLERELRAAFESFGFEVSPHGKKAEPDGIAVAHLAGTAEGKSAYRVSLEAKSKQRAGAKVTAKSVGVSTVARHRDDDKFNCDHAFVLGPDFPTGSERNALKSELLADAKSHKPKNITCCRIEDFARLIEIYPLKRLNLARLRTLFNDCRTPEDVAAVIDQWAGEKIEEPPYAEVLQEIWKLQEDQSDEGVGYAAVRTRLLDKRQLKISTEVLKQHCLAMQMMTGHSYVSAGSMEVSMTVPPEKVLSFIKGYADRSLGAQKKIGVRRKGPAASKVTRADWRSIRRKAPTKSRGV